MLLATAQPVVSGDIASNGAAIRDLIARAADQGAEFIHFPETALSGYVKEDVRDWRAFDWPAHAAELDAIRAHCGERGIGAAIGSAHQHPALPRPFNSVYVISDKGEIAGRYDKRFCSHTEISDWYAAGDKPLVVEVAGQKLGVVVCIEVNFPELFMEYERLGVDVVLFSSSHAKTETFYVQARGHAACNTYWISYSVPARSRQVQSSCLIGPDGSTLDSAPLGVAGLAINRIDPTATEWDIPINKARPWRRAARKGDIYAAFRLGS